MIDTHCHIDMYTDPLDIAQECERLGIITIGMTNLPSHFEMGYSHLQSFTKVRLALGMHPLYAGSHKEEFSGFIRNLSKTSYIGEVGLDFSKEGINTKELQLESFQFILNELSGKKKILSLHSRKAEKFVLELLIKYNIKNAIFHWYSGPLALIDPIANAGYYFSVNTAMTKSKSGQEIINRIPSKHILTESDGPYIENNGTPIKPANINIIHKHLSKQLNLSETETVQLIKNNFHRLISNIK